MKKFLQRNYGHNKSSTVHRRFSLFPAVFYSTLIHTQKKQNPSKSIIDNVSSSSLTHKSSIEKFSVQGEQKSLEKSEPDNFSSNLRIQKNIVFIDDLEKQKTPPKESIDERKKELETVDLKEFIDVELFTQATGLNSLKNFVQTLGVTFYDDALLQKAFNHYVIGIEPIPQDQSHVAVGRELFRLLTTQYYVANYPNLTQEFLSRVVEKVSSSFNVALRARELGFGPFIHLHPRIEITLFKRPEEATFLLLKNTLFAFIASLFRDQGFDNTLLFSQKHVFEFYLKETTSSNISNTNNQNEISSSNTRQELSSTSPSPPPQKKTDPFIIDALSNLDINKAKFILAHLFTQMNKPQPVYRVIEQDSKNKTIVCGVFSNETLLTTGTGTSIREASEKAAYMAVLNFYGYKIKSKNN